MPHLKEHAAPATLETMDGRPVLRFERQLAYPVERVWRALSEPTELERWFPAAAAWTPAVGATFEAAGTMGEVTEVDAPSRLAWTYDGEDYRFELSPTDDGSRLVFTHAINDGTLAAQTATGWDTYLARLEPHLAGGFLSEEEAHVGWEEIHEHYAERFGVDPTPGRRFAKTLRAGG
jgi:uncharacterized protein YndB with AHSA1/START domain